jgi:hypothetical protein
VTFQQARDALKNLDFRPMFTSGRGRLVLSPWWLSSDASEVIDQRVEAVRE